MAARASSLLDPFELSLSPQKLVNSPVAEIAILNVRMDSATDCFFDLFCFNLCLDKPISVLQNKGVLESFLFFKYV